MLELVDEGKRDEFWQHRGAQADLGRGDTEAALSKINKALDQLRDEKFRSAFLEVRFEVRKELGDDSATEDLREAVARQADGKYKDQLQSRLEGELSTKVNLAHDTATS